MTKKKTIAKKLTIKIVIGLTAVFLILITAMVLTTKNDLTARELDKLTMLASKNASIAKNFMEGMLNKENVLKTAFQTIEDVQEDKRVDYMSGLLTDIKKTDNHILSIFYVTEPNSYLPEFPNGVSIFCTDNGLSVSEDRFANINEAAYKQILESKNMVIVDPFEKQIDGKTYMVITVLVPVLDADGNVMGLIGSNIDTAVLNAAPYDHGGYKTFSNQIICGHQAVIIYSDDTSIVGKKYIDVAKSADPQRILDSVTTNSALTLLDKNQDGSSNYRSYLPFYVGSSTVGWLSGSSITKAEFDGIIVKQLAIIVLIAIVGLLALSTFIYVIIKNALVPMSKFDNAAKEMARGNLGFTIVHESNDEFGRLADNMSNSMSAISSYIADIDRAMGEMAKGNFNLEASQPFIGDFENIELSITHFIMEITDMLYTIHGAANTLSDASEQIMASSETIAQAALEETASIEELTSSIGEISGQIKHSADNALEASRKTNLVEKEILHSNNQMFELVDAMNKIGDSASGISKIVGTIEGIATQINLLALNAAIEAARAGEAGKGFAVVADEVRDLAGKSANAVNDTAALISASIEAVENGIQIAHSTANSLKEVVIGVQDVSQNVAKISERSGMQSNEITQIKESVEEIARMITTMSASTEESAAASENMDEQVTVLKQLLKKFTLKS